MQKGATVRNQIVKKNTVNAFRQELNVESIAGVNSVKIRALSMRLNLLTKAQQKNRKSLKNGSYNTDLNKMLIFYFI